MTGTSLVFILRARLFKYVWGSLLYSMQINHTIFYDISTDMCFRCLFHQTSEHPNPGKKFSARGFPRHCYLPDNEKGRKVRTQR